MDTITVLKGNIELQIKPEEKAYYMGKGYSVIDESGNIVEEAMLQDVASLQVKVAELEKENAELKKALSKTAEKAKPGPKKKAEQSE